MDLWHEFFVRPIESYSGYNLVNTLVYAIILIAIAFLVVYPLFKRFKVRFDFPFALSILPYILAGISFRIFEDLHLLPRSADPLSIWYYTISPGIWILIGGFTILALLVSLLVARKTQYNYQNVFRGIGLLAAIPLAVLAMLQFTEWLGFILVLILTAVLSLAVFKLSDLKTKLFQSNLNKLTLAGQTLDGAATFIATTLFSCGEQHVLPGMILDFFPPLFLLVKVGLVWVILYYLDREIEDENLRGFIKLIVLILGFSTGLRDVFTLGAGSCGTLL